jgi:hypothetical protein
MASAGFGRASARLSGGVSSRPETIALSIFGRNRLPFDAIGDRCTLGSISISLPEPGRPKQKHLVIPEHMATSVLRRTGQIF